MRKTIFAALGILSIFALSSNPARARPIPNPLWEIRQVEALSLDTIERVFSGDELAVVSVIGDGDTDLDLYVLDEDGEVVASDNEETDVCSVSWQPTALTKYRIVVINLGEIYNEYLVVTN